MTERTPSQVNESLDNAWVLIRELQDAQRAIARSVDDLCLRVSQNNDALQKALYAQEQQCATVAHSHAKCMMTNAHSIEKLETKVEQIDTVLDHDTDSMLLSNLCKRVTDLELVAQIRSKVVEPSVEVIIRDQTVPLDEIKRACLMLGATRVVVDAGGIGATLLRYLQADGLPAVAMAKPEKAWWKS